MSPRNFTDLGDRSPIVRLPEEISFYEYEGENKKFEQALETIQHPHAIHNRLLVSFAAAHEIQAHLPLELTVSLRGTANFADFLEGKLTEPVGPPRRNANAWAVRMLREPGYAGRGDAKTLN